MQNQSYSKKGPFNRQMWLILLDTVLHYLKKAVLWAYIVIPDLMNGVQGVAKIWGEKRTKDTHKSKNIQVEQL